MYLQETQQCIPNLAVADSIILLTLIHLLRREFLHSLSNRCVLPHFYCFMGITGHLLLRPNCLYSNVFTEEVAGTVEGRKADGFKFV